MGAKTISTIIIDLLTLGLGSYGAYILIRELVEYEKFPSLKQSFQILRKHWLAALALLVANIFFISRLYLGLLK
jgi:hypothetical protein